MLPLPPATQALLLTNVAIYFLTQLLGPNMFSTFALWPLGHGFWPWQVVSYGFLHFDFNHLFFNMLGLWMFGGELEHVWGHKRFLVFYFASVIAAALTQLLVNYLLGSGAPTVGASGGLFGLLLPMTKSYMATTDLKQAAADAVAQLRAQGAKMIIAVTHENMPDDVALVQSVPGIDLVIGGHDHLYAREQVGRVWVAKGDADAKKVLVYDVNVGDSVDVKPRCVPVDASIAKDADVDAAVTSWMTQLEAKIPGGAKTQVGTTKYLLEGTEPAVRGKETALGNLLVDAARERMKVDVAFVNGGSIRINDDIPAGAPITNYDLEGIFYYRNALVAFELTGQQLLDILNNSVSLADTGDGRFLQVSGLRFRYGKVGDKFVVNASDVEVGGAPLDLAKKYTTTTLDYVYMNGAGDGYTIFGSDATRPPKISTPPEPDHREVVEAYIRALPNQLVTTNVDGRITRTTPVATPPSCP